ncbi:DUF4124 domain-containing protein, partial [Psychromonas sp.]|nr:DUF4124 domain-containing protein [Psychromonas sp.]
MKFSVACVSTLLFLSTSIVQAETKIYQWVDADGSTHFSDTAVPGTEQITAGNKNLVSADVLKPNSTTKKQSTTPTQDKAISYQAEIISPQDDMAIRSNEGTIEVHVKT